MDGRIQSILARSLGLRSGRVKLQPWTARPSSTLPHWIVLAILVSAAPAFPADDLPRRKPRPSSTIRQHTERDRFGYPLVTADKVEIVRLLRDQSFAELDGMIGDYRRDAEADFHYEDWIGDAIDAFSIPDPSLQRIFDRWIETIPESPDARLARGAYWTSLAWAARGHKSIAETTSAQLDAMREYVGRALQDVHDAIRLDPDFGEAFFYLVNLHSMTGGDEQRRQAFEAGANVNPHSYRLRFAYMNSLLPRWGGSYAEMEAFAAESERLAGTNPRLRILRGCISQDRGRSLPSSGHAERRKAFSEALSYGPGFSFFVSRGDEHWAEKHYADALDDYRRAQALRPQEARVLRKMAEMLLVLEQRDEARAALTAADEFDLAGIEKDRRAEVVARMSVRAGYEAYKSGDTEAALAELDRAGRVYPSNAPSHYWRGRILLKAGDLQQALGEFREAVQSDPRDIESIKNIDYILSRDRKWEDIINYWDSYLRLEPESAEGYLERGGSYFHKGDRERALADADRACRLGHPKGCEVARRYGPSHH